MVGVARPPVVGVARPLAMGVARPLAMGVARPLAMGVALPLAVGVANRLRGKCLGGGLGASWGRRTCRGLPSSWGRVVCRGLPSSWGRGLLSPWERMAGRAPGSWPASPLDFRLEGPENNI